MLVPFIAGLFFHNTITIPIGIVMLFITKQTTINMYFALAGFFLTSFLETHNDTTWISSLISFLRRNQNISKMLTRIVAVVKEDLPESICNGYYFSILWEQYLYADADSERIETIIDTHNCSWEEALIIAKLTQSEKESHELVNVLPSYDKLVRIKEFFDVSFAAIALCYYDNESITTLLDSRSKEKLMELLEEIKEEEEETKEDTDIDNFFDKGTYTTFKTYEVETDDVLGNFTCITWEEAGKAAMNELRKRKPLSESMIRVKADNEEFIFKKD
jgi:mannose-1-phosphate guanylyltransferase